MTKPYLVTHDVPFHIFTGFGVHTLPIHTFMGLSPQALPDHTLTPSLLSGLFHFWPMTGVFTPTIHGALTTPPGWR